MTSRANRIAHAVLNEFNKLPTKRKPLVRDNGLHEWVPLSGIVAEKDGEYSCLALATGMKCLPASKIPDSNGVAIHDWHAEILAIRTFNRHLLDECHRILAHGSDSGLLKRNVPSQSLDIDRAHVPPFEIRDDIKLHMYCSEAPCGDASMELTIGAQQDATPWDIPDPATLCSPKTSLPGREFFSQLGVVRRKPARRDAPPTLSKSCSDKLALKQCASLLSALASLFVNPSNSYIDVLVLPESQYSHIGCERGFSRHGRMKSLDGRHWPGGYSFKPFKIDTTDVEFYFSKRSVMARAEKISASNLAAAWSTSGVEETILGGIIQGRKPFDIRGASRMSRRQMWGTALDLARDLDDNNLRFALDVSTYGDVKEGPLLAARRQVKAEVRGTALAGWVKNEGDSRFKIDPSS